MRKKLRILVLSSLFPNQLQPAFGIFVENRLSALRVKYDLDVTVVAPVAYFPFAGLVLSDYRTRSKIAQEEMRDGVAVYHPRYLHVPKFGMSRQASCLARSVLKCVKRLISEGQQFDLIDAHYLYPDGVAAEIVAKELDLPFIMTARGSDVTQIGRMPAYQKQILKACNAASQVVTVSSSLRDELIDMGANPARTTVLRNGVDLTRYQPNQPKPDDLTGESGLMPQSYFLTVGGLVPRKRVVNIIQALKGVEDSHLVVIGDGQQADMLRSVSGSLGLVDRVHFMGSQPPETVARWMAHAQALILASSREGWANVILESMACGSPVIATDVGASNQVITSAEYGTLVKVDDTDGLANAMNRWRQKKPNRNNIRQHAETYSWDATSDGQYQLFMQAIDKFKKAK